MQMRVEYPAVKAVMVTDEELLKQLNKLRGSPRTVIVGIGNVLKGDDAAGPLVCEQLRRAGVAAELIDAGTAPENYIQPIIEIIPEHLLVIDAMDFSAPPGTVRLFKPEQLSSSVWSTHTLSPRVFIDVVCQDVEVDVYFVGIQPAQVQLGQPVSPQVKRAIEEVSHLIAETFPLAND